MLTLRSGLRAAITICVLRGTSGRYGQMTGEQRMRIATSCGRRLMTAAVAITGLRVGRGCGRDGAGDAAQRVGFALVQTPSGAGSPGTGRRACRPAASGQAGKPCVGTCQVSVSSNPAKPTIRDVPAGPDPVAVTPAVEILWRSGVNWRITRIELWIGLWVKRFLPDLAGKSCQARRRGDKK